MNENTDQVNELLQMLLYRRPHMSSGEKLFVNKFILSMGAFPLGKLESSVRFPTSAGSPAAYVRVVRKADGELSRTLFSSHTDTVHHDDAMQKVVYDDVKRVVYKTDGEPLGADDGAGVWLMLQMIRAKVPGTYVFHRGEERGGIGSTYLAANHKDFLASHDRAIAFDRKATSSVITHQGMGRCCSDTFGSNLADRLNDLMPDDAFATDSTGVYTDTAEYVNDIAECTNVSCGYYNEHTKDELLDVAFLERLAEACIKLDWEALPTVRKPGEVERGRHWWSSPLLSNETTNSFFPEEDLSISEIIQLSDEEITDLCWNSPDIASQAIQDLRDQFFTNNQ